MLEPSRIYRAIEVWPICKENRTFVNG